ncbi:hypothetical protein [Absidia glauca]|uniref:MULE transposase domain-containing protein n=1 Tax=Absidia glauca TaxID=4829 RepID=A0A168RDJ7_ABSGL|nr:hypothetical protein [Absidia glauca]
MHFEFDLNRHMNMQSIEAILRLSLEQLDNKHDATSRKHAIDRSSAQAWWDDLKTKNHSTYLFEQENGLYVVSWYSQWQKELLEGALDWCVDSTNHTYKQMTDSNLAFMLTSNEIIPNRVKWLNHLKQHNNLNVQRIMIDCSTTEINAIRKVFGDTVDNILCYWHIKRA